MQKNSGKNPFTGTAQFTSDGFWEKQLNLTVLFMSLGSPLHPTTREEENRRGEQTDGILDMNNHSFSLNCQGVLTCLGQEDEPITYSGPSDFDSGKAGSRPWFNRAIVVVWTWPE